MKKLCITYVMLVALASAMLTSCGGGGGGGISPSGGGGDVGGTTISLPPTEAPPDQNEIQVRAQSGNVQLPAGAPVAPASLSVISTFGDGLVSAAGDFSVPTNQLTTQAVAAIDSQNRTVLLGMSGLSVGGNPQLRLQGAAGSLSPRSTALTLVFLSPLLATPDREAARRIGTFLNSLSEVSELESVITSQIRVNGFVDFTVEAVRQPLTRAVRAAVTAAQQGRLSSNLTADRTTPRVAPARRSVTPTDERSGVVVETLDDRDREAIRIRITNYKTRFLELWGQAADGNGVPISGSRVFPVGSPNFVPAADAFTITGALSGLITGQTLGPGDKELTQAIPSEGERLLLQVWGLGRMNPSAGSVTEFLQRASFATVGTILVNFVGPSLDAVIGARLLTRGPGRPTDLFNLLREINTIQDLAQDAVDGNIVAAGIGLLQFLIDNPVGRRALANYVASIGFNVSLAALSRLNYFLTALSVAESIGELAQGVVAITSSQSRQDFVVSPGNTSATFQFQVTLVWNKPNDVDLHTFAPNGEHSSYLNPAIGPGELDVDDTDGFGPENFTCRRSIPGLYRIAVNLYDDYDLADPSTQPRIRVRSSSGTTDFGPGILTVPSFNGGYPVTTSTASWWRPCDIRLNSNGSVSVLSADTSVSLRQSTIDLMRTRYSRKSQRATLSLVPHLR